MRDGGNLTSVLTQLSPTVKTIFEEYLEVLCPVYMQLMSKRGGPWQH